MFQSAVDIRCTSYKISQEIFDHKVAPPISEADVLNSSNTSSLSVFVEKFLFPTLQSFGFIIF